LASGCSTNPCGTFIANDVEPIGVSLSSASQVELEGLVTSLTSTADFMVDFQRVQTNVSTIYSGGVAADVLAGTKLEVEGSLSAGVITATKVRFKDNVVIDANAIAPTGINSGNLTLLEIEGMPGVTVSANFLTKFDNGSIASAANLSSLYGKSVRIRGRLNSGGSGGLVIATRIQDHGAANTTGNMSLTAYVPKNLALTGPTFSMLGLLTIDTSAPSPNFKNDQGLSINSATFFVTLKNGAMVTAVHQLSDSLVSNSAFLPGALKEVQLGDSQD
jgi:hypothetical protein